jgi:MYXO-CTERM domain-containing protein
LDVAEKALVVAAGIALVGSVAAIEMTALQALANPSGTAITSVAVIVASGASGMVGVAAFGVLWLLRNIRRRK